MRDARSSSAVQYPGGQPRLDRHEKTGDQDKDWHDAGEGSGRKDQQKARPGQATESSRDQEWPCPPRLAGKFPPVADRPTDGARDDADRVRHVRDQRWIAEEQESREGQQGACTDDRVDHPGCDAGGDDEGCVERIDEWDSWRVGGGF
jgi:hypothetical protein